MDTNLLSSMLPMATVVQGQSTLFESWFVIPATYYPIAIFLLRTADISISTLRTFAVARGRRLPAWILGFVQALLFVTAVSAVLIELDNLWNILAFAAGMATGNVIGMTIERLIAPGHSLLRMYSPGRGEALTEELRKQGYGATLVSGEGLEGTVSLIYCYVPRRKVPLIQKQMINLDPDVYISSEHVRQLRGGWRV